MSQRAGKGSARRAAIAGAVAGLALMMLAAPAAASGQTAVPAASADRAASTAQLTDVSAAKRERRAVRRSHGSSAAGMAFMGMAMGMIGTAIAESQRRDYYDYYYGRPAYYGPRYYRAPDYGYYGGAYQPRRYYYRRY